MDACLPSDRNKLLSLQAAVVLTRAIQDDDDGGGADTALHTHGK